MVGVTGRPTPWSRIRSLPDETSREACNIGSLTSTPTKRLCAPKRFTNRPSTSPLEQPKSTIEVSGFTNFENGRAHDLVLRDRSGEHVVEDRRDRAVELPSFPGRHLTTA